ncbi:MAG: DMT family transporter [Paracoccaceae bacterium]|nr:DMT family transporter [Paracoccaceae bacterium]
MLKSNITCALAVLSFAIGFPALEILLNDWGFVSVVLVRNIIAFILILSIWILKEGFETISLVSWSRGFMVGAIGYGFGSVLLVITQVLTTTFTAAFAAALMPLAAIFLEILLDKRRITKKFILGLTLVIIGSIVILEKTLTNVKFNLGLIIGLLAVTFFAWGSRATVKYLPEISILARTSITTLGMVGFSFLIYLFCMSFKLGATSIPQIKIEYIYLFIIYAGFGLAISQILWIKSVNELGIGTASFHLNINPFYVMLILFLIGYEWNWLQAAGAIVVISGITITQINFNKS